MDASNSNISEVASITRFLALCVSLQAEEELELLRGTSLHAITVQWKNQVDSDLADLAAVELPSRRPRTARDALEGFLTKEAYLWALGTVRRHVYRYDVYVYLYTKYTHCIRSIHTGVYVDTAP